MARLIPFSPLDDREGLLDGLEGLFYKRLEVNSLRRYTGIDRVMNVD